MVIVNAVSGSTIHLGIQGESGARTIRFDLAIFSGCGPGTAQLVVQRPHDKTPYLAGVEVQDGALLWTVTGPETALTGYGWCELRHLRDDIIVKSELYRTFVATSIQDQNNPPLAPPYDSYLERMSKLGAETSQSAEAAAQSAREAAQQAAAASEIADQVAQTAVQVAGDADDAKAALGLAETARKAAEAAQKAAEAAQAAAGHSASDSDTAKRGAEAALKEAQSAAGEAEKALSDLRMLYGEMRTWAQDVEVSVSQSASVASAAQAAAEAARDEAKLAAEKDLTDVDDGGKIYSADFIVRNGHPVLILTERVD